jgi:hypothetical protein
MAYVRTKTIRNKRTGKVYTYQQRQESYRVGKKVKTRYLGPVKRRDSIIGPANRGGVSISFVTIGLPLYALAYAARKAIDPTYGRNARDKTPISHHPSHEMTRDEWSARMSLMSDDEWSRYKEHVKAAPSLNEARHAHVKCEETAAHAAPSVPASSSSSSELSQQSEQVPDAAPSEADDA